jgi:hypothetical protein
MLPETALKETMRFLHPCVRTLGIGSAIVYIRLKKGDLQLMDTILFPGRRYLSSIALVVGDTTARV